jgi:hypothetical protein
MPVAFQGLQFAGKPHRLTVIFISIPDILFTLIEE